MTEVKQLRFAFLIALILLPLQWRREMGGSVSERKSAGHENAYFIDLNKAGNAELTLIPGIGPSLAEKIIKFRETTGSFCSIQCLEEVKGIGPARICEIKNWVRLK